MRRFSQLSLFAGAVCFLVAYQADAQLIQISPNGFGGVNIRAPFVRINTNPNGPTHVRAPFVDVNAPPAYYQPQPYYVQPYPNGGYAPGYRPPMNGAPIYGVPNSGGTIVQPPSLINSSDVAPLYPAESGIGEPSVIPTPALQPGSSAGRDLPHNELPTPEGLNSVLETSSAPVNDVPSSRRELIAGANGLHQALTQYANAKIWQEFLDLPSFVRDDSSWVNRSAISQDQWNQLAKTLSRFEKTNSKSEIHLINGLNEFRRTHRELTNFVRLVENRVQNDTFELPPPPNQAADK